MAETRQQKQDRHPILITGAAGLIGCRLAESLSADYPVVGFDVSKPDQKLPNVDWIHCDLTDDDAVIEALARLRERHGEKLASVIHLADSHYAVDISKAKRLLGWEPRHSLRGTLREMLRRLREDPRRWYRENQLELSERLTK